MAPGDKRCDVSPFCGSIEARARALGVPAELPWRWAHLGPIGTDIIRLVEHRPRCSPSFHGGAAPRLQGWRLDRTLSADGPIGRFGGYHLDLLGMPSPPVGIDANYHAVTGLWYVYAVAWRHAEEPRAEWHVAVDGIGGLTLIEGTDGLRPDFWAIARRCADLLNGRLSRVGHPISEPDEAWRNYEIALKAESMKARDPSLPYRVIAQSLGVSERALRNYRVSAARWHHSTRARRMA